MGHCELSSPNTDFPLQRQVIQSPDGKANCIFHHTVRRFLVSPWWKVSIGLTRLLNSNFSRRIYDLLNKFPTEIFIHCLWVTPSTAPMNLTAIRRPRRSIALHTSHLGEKFVVYTYSPLQKHSLSRSRQGK